MGKKSGSQNGGRAYPSSSPYQPAANLLNEIWGGTHHQRRGITSGTTSRGAVPGGASAAATTTTTTKSLKAAAYDSKSGQLNVSKLTYAIACRVLERRQLLDSVLEQVPEINNTTTDAGGKKRSVAAAFARNEGLLYVLLHELLLGPNRSIRGGGTLKRKLVEHEEKCDD